MSEELKRPNAALINREWFQSAASVLPADGLGLVLVAAVEYVFAGDTRVKLNPTESIVFTMIKPALDSDVSKYLERCARNAANAKAGRERVAASGSDSQRVGANTTTTSTPTPKTTTTTTPSLSPTESEERERWLVFGYFWSIGSNAIEQELNAFWSYYESLGWCNNKKAPIVNKLAAARMWRRQFETKKAPDGSEVWFKVMQDCPVCDYRLFLAYMGAERTEAGAVVRLQVSEAWLKAFRDRCAGQIESLRKSWRVPEISFERVP